MLLGILLLIIFGYYFIWGMLHLFAFLYDHPRLFVVFSLSCIIFPSWLWYDNWESDMKVIGFFIFLPVILGGIRLLPTSLIELLKGMTHRKLRDKQNRKWEKHLRKKVEDGRMTEKEFMKLTKL
jgi:energy-coupling factor transporter transmembrane protein EcfT